MASVNLKEDKMWKCKRCGSEDKWFNRELCMQCYEKTAFRQEIKKIKVVKKK